MERQFRFEQKKGGTFEHAKKPKDSSSDSIESSFQVNGDTDLDFSFADDSSEDQMLQSAMKKNISI